jgi:hypothetical protein
MNNKKRTGWALLILSLSLAFIFSACVGIKKPIPSTPQVIQPTVLITQFITQIVATPTITPTPAPTEVVPTTAPTLATGWDPSQVPIYYPIGGCVASRLHTGDVAFVANGGGVEGIHFSKDIGYAPIFRKLENGELVDIYKGPWCSNGSIIWRVVTSDKKIGFVEEGNGSVYYLMPMPEGTPRVVSNQDLKEILQNMP